MNVKCDYQKCSRKCESHYGEHEWTPACARECVDGGRCQQTFSEVILDESGFGSGAALKSERKEWEYLQNHKR